MSVAARTVESSPEEDDHRTGAGKRAAQQLLVLTGYLLGAIAVTQHLWADPARLAQIGDPGDVNQFAWFMRYSATAIASGHFPAFVTSAMNAPHTVNLLVNTSFLLPGMILTPVTLLAGPQVSLNVALALGFAGSAASMFFVLRRWQASVIAAALGGAVYGFSPALLNSGIGHYHVQFAVLPPLIIHTLLRIVTGRGASIRTGVMLGVLTGTQLFIGAEVLVITGVTAALVLLVLLASAPRQALQHARGIAAGLATAAVVGLVICGRALWVEFAGPSIQANSADLVHYRSHLYALVTPSSALYFHTPASAAAAALYPEPQAEYLAYLGVPLLVVLIAAAIFFWRQLPVRVTAVTFVALEVFSLGGTALLYHGSRAYPAFLLPWYWLEHLPLLNSVLPGRLTILADGAAGALLAFALDLTRTRLASAGGRIGRSWLGRGLLGRGWLATAIAVLAVLPLIPLPYQVADVTPVPSGWTATFARLHLRPGARVLIVPVAYYSLTQPLRWQADTSEPDSMIGGDFIAASSSGGSAKGGTAGQTPTTVYLDQLWRRYAHAHAPSRAQIRADLASWQPDAVVADTTLGSRLGRFLIALFGPPTAQIGRVLSWRLSQRSSP